MELIDIYNSIKNPLDDPTIVDTLINKYEESTSGNFYTSLTKSTKKENVGSYYINDHNKFFSGLFNAWKHSVLSMTREQFEILKKHGSLDDTFIKLRNYLKTVPDVKTEEEARHIIYGSYKDKELEDAFDKYSWDAPGHYSSWVFVNSRYVNAKKTAGMLTEHRLYINSDSLDTYKVAMEFVKKCINRNIPYDFKFDVAGNRDDTIVIYSDTEHLVDFINILNEIKKEQPEIGARFKTPPLLTGKIGDWIGYGSEPVIEGKKDSFNGLRAKVIDHAITEVLTKWLENNMIRLITFRNNTIHISEYASVLITEAIIQQLTSRYTWSMENETRVAKDQHRNPDYQKIVNKLGYSDKELKSAQFKNGIYRLVLKELSNNIVDILRKDNNTTELSIPLNNGVKFDVYTSYIKSSLRKMLSKIVQKDPDLKNEIKETIKIRCSENGIDPNNIAFDKRITEKFKVAPMPKVHKPVEVEPVITHPKVEEQKPQKKVPMESLRVVKTKESPFVHTTYVPSRKLLSTLDEYIDYNPDKVIPFIYENMNAIRLLFPELIRKNRPLADKFLNENVTSFPELQDIYNNSLHFKRSI